MVKISSEQIEGSQVVLSVEVDEERLEHAMAQAYRRMANRTNIPGFRKGKAPRHMIERFYGRDAVLEEALEHLIPEAYHDAIEEEKIDVIAQPKVEVVQSEPLIFKATVPVRPTVELGDYHQLHFSLDAKAVTDEEFDSALEQMRTRYAQWEPVDRPVAIGDMLTADIENTVGDQPSSVDTDVNYIVTENFPFPMEGFSEQLVGIEKDGRKEFTLSFPEDHENEEVAGKKIKFSVTVKEIKEKKLPELDDEFSKTASDEFENLQQLKDKLLENMVESAQAEAKRSLEDQAVAAVVGLARVDYPDVMIDHEVEHLIQNDSSLPRDKEGRMDSYLSSIGKTEQELKAEWRPQAIEKVLRSLVMQRLAELENIQVTEDDVNTEIGRIADGSGESADAIRNLFSSETGRESLERMLLSKKTIDRLIEIVTAKESPTTPARRRRRPAKAEETAGAVTEEEVPNNKETDS
ncbi:MAG: trigger factor [Dehalococcoidia bacterium]|nr:trigger factor [Dehalococcoidia bacterium]